MTFLLAVAIGSLVLALVMSLVAWQVAKEERSRSEARVAALAADIHASAPAAARAAGQRSEPARRFGVARRGPVLLSAQTPSASARPAIVVGVGLLMFATAAAMLAVLGGSAASRPGAGDAAISPRVPLELVALGHNRDGDRLTVRGVIRNPAGGARLAGLTAVVFMFDKEGGFLGSGRGSIDAASLAPGADSTFVVSVPGASSVARYRVSFRTETGIVAHVDKRSRP